MSRNIAQQKLAHTRSTAKFHVFEAADDTAPVRNIYVSKLAFEKPEPPAHILITVESEGADPR